MEQSIITELANQVLTITLNRPDKLNAFTDSMAQQLQKSLKTAAEEQDIRCVLLTGAGKAFCAGQDLSEVLEKGEDHALGDTVRSSYNPVIKAIREIPKPVVCTVNGTAAAPEPILLLPAISCLLQKTLYLFSRSVKSV